MNSESIKQLVDFNGAHLNRILTRLMEKNKISLTALFKNTGIAIPTLKRLQSTPDANPTIATLLPIANFFNITINQLIGVEQLPNNITGYIESRVGWTKVPIIDWKHITTWLDQNILEQTTTFISTDIEISKNTFALEVFENNWIGFMYGSVLIIDPALEPTHKDYVIVHKENQPPTLKQILFDENKVYLKPLILDFQTSFLDTEHRFLGVLVQVRNDIKLAARKLEKEK